MPLSPTTPDPVPAPIASLLEVFTQELHDVAFPDVDAAKLGEAVDRVRAAAEELARLDAAREAARAALQEAQDGLLQKAQRALNYARVFSEDREALAARLDGITLPRSGRARPRAEGGTSTLPAAAAVSEPVIAEGATPPPARRGRRPSRPSVPLFADEPAAPAS